MDVNQTFCQISGISRDDILGPNARPDRAWLDGEVRRENYIFYQCRRLNGVSFDTVTHKSVRQGAFEADLPTIVGPVSLTETRLAEDWKAAQQFTTNPVKITIPGPLTISAKPPANPSA